MKKKSILLIAMFLMLGLAFCNLGFANTISYDLSFVAQTPTGGTFQDSAFPTFVQPVGDPFRTGFGLTFISFNTQQFLNLSLPQFNPALGALTKVNVDLTYTLNSNGSIIAVNAGRLNYLLIAEAKWELNGQSAAQFEDNFTNYQQGSFAYAGGNTVNTLYDKTVAQDPVSLVYTDASGMNPFIGTGSFNAKFFSAAEPVTTLNNTSGGFQLSYITTFSLTEKVTYEYNTAPLPGTILLLGTGLAGLMFYRRRQGD